MARSPEIKAVVTNITTIFMMILPSLFISPMLAIEEVTLKKTSGTMIVNIRFKKICPKGSSTFASGPITAPIIPPTRMDKSKIKENL
jgi:hypothetical protein